jgi:hypothetical protein
MIRLMSLALLALAMISFLVCQVYGCTFAYQSRLDQPPQYAKAKRFLNRLSVVLILLTAGSLIADNLFGWAVLLVVGTSVTAYLAHGLTYRRAVVRMSESIDPKTGEYIFGSTPRERMENARLFINAAL